MPFPLWNDARSAAWQHYFCFRPTFWLAVVAPSAFSIMMIRGFFGFLRQGSDTSLKWDIFLAWIPVFFALGVYIVSSTTTRWRWLLWPGIALWLLFFPNSPYLLTQFVHFQLDYSPDRRIPLNAWYDYLHITAVSVAGLLLTLTSLRLIEIAFARKAGRFVSALFVFVVIVLASFGVALGRFARLNSWDPFTRPYTTLTTILEHASDNAYQKTTAVLAMLLLCVYVSARQMGAKRPAP